MKNSELVIRAIAVVAVVMFIIGFAGGYYLKQTTISLEDYIELGSHFDIEEVEEEKDCSTETLAVRTELEGKCQEVTEIRKGQWKKCDEQVECDCTMDFQNGIIEGRVQAVQEALMYSGTRETSEEYCKLHFCQEQILRRTRPINRY